jgi:ABC-2 type transport system permease protein
MKTLIALTIANLKGLTRDRAALFWTFFFPIMFVLLFGVLFSGSGSNTKVTVGYVDLDNSAASAQVRADFATYAPILDLRDGTLDAEKAAMKNGDVSAVIVIPQGLGAAATRTTPGAPLEITLYTDPSQTQTTQVVQGGVNGVASAYSFGVASSGQPPVLIVGGLQTLSSTNISTVTYLVPSILAMALMQLGVFAAVPLVQQREKGILKRLGATPLQRWKLVASNILLRLVVAAVDTVLIIGVGIAAFNIQIVGNVLLSLGFVFLGAGAFLSLGFMLASFLKTEEQATGVVQVVQMPLMFLSGIFFPFTFMPDFLRSVARLLPLTYLGDGLRQSMVNAPQIAPLGIDALILAGWTVVCLAVAARSFRWE